MPHVMASADLNDAAAAGGKAASDGPTLHAFTATVVTDNFGKRIQALEVRAVALPCGGRLVIPTLAQSDGISHD